MKAKEFYRASKEANPLWIEMQSSDTNKSEFIL
jgi:hypothetical protein